jgi:hypothetical protein
MYDGKFSIPTALIIASLFLASFSALAQNKINERLLASSEENQEKYFTETLQKYGMECGSVSRAFYQGSGDDELAYWGVACTNGENYSFQISKETEKPFIITCNVLALIFGWDCFEKLEDLI